jgi:predicted lipase
MTIQKVFMDSIHLWIVPLVLVGMKVLYDILPKPLFFGMVALVIVGYVANQKMQTTRIERTAKELEEEADTFLDELDATDKAKREKETKKKALKEQQKIEKMRVQQKQQVFITLYIFYIF